MKNLIVFATIVAISFAGFSQTKKVPVKKASSTKVTSAPAPLKNALDSFSYAVGLAMANFYKEQGVQSINQSLVIKALNDVKSGKALLNEAQANNCIMSYTNEKRREIASGNRKAGEAFLSENKKKTGVITLPSGLQYLVIKEGTGPKPTSADKVKVHYEGSLIDGTIFESSIQRGEPIEFNITGVIPGWTEALQLMSIGSKWKLFIPSHLAYGDNQPGPDIKPGSTLIFDVELLDILK